MTKHYRVTKKPSPSPTKIDQARRLYDRDEPIPKIIKLLGMSVSQFRRFRLKQGWALREQIARRHESDLPPPRAKDRTPQPQALIARLEDAVEREFARAEQALDRNAPKSVEASARTLASLVKTLAELKRMRREQGARDNNDAANARDERPVDEPPLDMAELRAELTRRLERLAKEGAAG